MRASPGAPGHGDVPRVGSMYDRVAHGYEALWDRDFRYLHEELDRMLDLRAGQRILDLACGPGAHLFSMAGKAGRPRAAIGVDLSLSMLHKAREKAAANGSLAVEFVHADMESFCRWARPGHFDVATVRFALAYVPADVGVAGPARLVAPGGQLGVVTSSQRSIPEVMEGLLEMCRDFDYPLPPLNHQVPRDGAELEKRLRAAGLRVEEIRNEKAELVRASGADVLQYLLDTGYIFHPFIETIVPDAQELLKEELGRRMDAKYRRADGQVAIEFDFLLATGRKG